MSGCPYGHHGVTKAVGCSHLAATHFSKLFPSAKKSDAVPISEKAAGVLAGPGGLMHDYDDRSPNSPVPSGYTFFAQFVDHDITLDVVSDLHGSTLSDKEVEDIKNLRSPSLDLDCVYGFGPEASPHIYDPARPGHIAVNDSGNDLARSPAGTALIGDPRNDENIFVSQLQLLMHKFHNTIFDRLTHNFEDAQRETRYHYQWLVLFDFLKRVCDKKVYKYAAPKILANDTSVYPIFYKPDAHGKLTMPAEFSVAAYRMGHTMVSSRYSVNSENPDIELFDERFQTLGFSNVPEQLIVDWRFLLPVCECIKPRMAKAFDPLLTDELQDLPVVGSRNPLDRALAFRNILRGNVFGLRSGQAVAKILNSGGYSDVNPDFDLELDSISGWSDFSSLAPKNHSYDKNTPLFFYILRESQLASDGQRLGPVGSAILLEVFGGMLMHCKTSFVKEGKNAWFPDPCISKEKRHWFDKKYKEFFSYKALVEDDDYYPFELADVVRFVEGEHCKE